MNFLFRFTAIFVLATLAFVSGGEAIHDLSHHDEEYCQDRSEHHLHEYQHHCDLCDLSFPSGDNSRVDYIRYFEGEILCAFQAREITFCELKPSLQLSLRGPPALS